jgi:hypothetical protein
MLAYPARRNEPWVSSRWLGTAAIGYIGIHVVWLLVYQRPVAGVYIVASLAAIAELILLASPLPATVAQTGRLGRYTGIERAPTPKRVAIVAFSATSAVFSMDWGRGLGLPAVGAVAVMVIVSAAAAWWFLLGSQRPGWTDRQRYAIAAGIFFLPAVSPFIELSGARGQIVVGIITGWLQVRQWRRIRACEWPAQEAAAQPAGGAGGDPAATAPVPAFDPDPAATI